ncbi:MAG TPA: ArsA family ATPase, partial [Actinomycetes bacterium]|nr:ArsA family ATPase [Actinomycetes bacterium]
KDIQADHFRTITESFSPLPILTCRLFDTEMVGLERLNEVADTVYGQRDPAAVLARTKPIRVTKEKGGGYALRVELPFTDRNDLDVLRKGDELLVKVGAYKRNVLLPQALHSLDVVAANLRAGALVVRFAAPEAGQATGGKRS